MQIKTREKERSETLYKNLIDTSESLIKAYEALFTVICNEKEALLSSSLTKLNKSNLEKESLISKIEFLEKKKTDWANLLRDHLSLKNRDTSLKTLGSYFKDEEKRESLKALHFHLKSIATKINEKNSYNKNLVQSALNHVHGAMDSIKNFPYENKVYERRGGLKRKKILSGHLISREI